MTTMITPSLWETRMIADLADQWDVHVLVDADRRHRLGLVGHGKTDFGLKVAYSLGQRLQRIADVLGLAELDFTFDLERDTVIRDDLVHFKRALREKRFGKIVVVDESEWFVHDNFLMYYEVRSTQPLLDSNRKEGGIYVWIDPNVYDVFGKLRNERGMWLARQNARGDVTLCVRDGTVDERRNVWGRAEVHWRGVPPLPRPLWKDYEGLYDAHMDLPCPLEDVCVAAIREQNRRERGRT